MKRLFLLACLFSVSISATAAEGIELDCDRLANDLIWQLGKEGLLQDKEDAGPRARKIVMTSCMTAEVSAQQQLKENKESWLKNWLLEDTGGKPGNKRLRNLKK